jgi:hypothetical protein
VLAVEGIGCFCALHLGIYLNAYDTKYYGFIAVCSLRRFGRCVIALRVFRKPAVLQTYNQDVMSVVCYVLSHDVQGQLYLFTEHVFITHIFFCLCICVIYSFIFTSFFLFLLSIVSSFLHLLYKSPSVYPSLPDSFSLFYLLFLSSISCVQFLPLFLFCSSLISFLLCLSLYLVFQLFLLTSLLSLILFCSCNLFVPVAAIPRFVFLLIFATLSSFVFH